MFVLMGSFYYDFGESGMNCDVFDSFKKANKRMQEIAQDIRKDFAHLDAEEDELTDINACWSIWERENYGYNHYDMRIVERAVK